MSLDFRIFGIGVRVHVWFLLVAFLLGMSQPEEAASLAYLGGFIAVLFVAVLVHELGHAVVGRAFGWKPSIELVAIGGFTRFEGIEGGKPWQRILMVLAGPTVNLLVGLACFVAYATLGDRLPPAGASMLNKAAFIHIFLAALNILPMLPLDGGQILLESLRWMSPTRGPRIAGYLMLLVVGLVAAWGAVKENPILIMIAFFSGIGAYRLARHGSLAPKEDALGLREQAYHALARRDGRRIVELAGKLVSKADAEQELDEAFHLLAWGRLFLGEPGEAKKALSAISRSHPTTHALEGAIALELGDADAALEQFEKILPRLNPWLEDYFVRAILLSRRWDEARTLFEDELGREFSVPSLLAVMTAARADGAVEAAEGMRAMVARKASARAAT